MDEILISEKVSKKLYSNLLLQQCEYNKKMRFSEVINNLIVEYENHKKFEKSQSE